MLFGGVVIAAVLALAGGFFFFANVPNPGAAREQLLSTSPQLARADIDRIIAERNAFAPRPSSETSGNILGRRASEPRAQSAPNDARSSSNSEGDELFRRGLYEEALSAWRRAAEAGDRWAAYRLGVEYLDGKPNVVMRDASEGAKWVRVAAELNEPLAQFELGTLYEYGVGVPADLQEAARWYLLSAQRGQPQAQYNIATLLETGEGIAQDKIESLKYYSLAASAGFVSISVGADGQIDNKVKDPRDVLKSSMSALEIEEAERRAAAYVPIED